MNAPWSAPEFEFRNGVLAVSSSLDAMRIRWQPEPLAEEQDRRERWRQFWPEFRLVAPESRLGAPDAADAALERKRRAFFGFRSSIPQALARIVEPFGSHQWNLLQAIHEEPAVRELAGHNPVLAYALANSHELRRTTPGVAVIQARRYCRSKQRDILKWLGFPGSEATVRLFRKIVPSAAAPSTLRRLRFALCGGCDADRLLAHHNRIGAGILEMVANRHLIALATPKLLQEIGQQAGEETEARTAGDLLDSLYLLQRVEPAREVRPFHSVQRVREFCDGVNGEFVACQQGNTQAREEERLYRAMIQERAWVGNRGMPRSIEEFRKRMFPEPPVSGTPDIVPIRRPADLVAEGREQRNCVGSYAGMVFGGCSYIYRVMAPQRATLEIVRGPDGCWRRGQLCQGRNRRAGKATVAAVDTWLARHSLSAGG